MVATDTHDTRTHGVRSTQAPHLNGRLCLLFVSVSRHGREAGVVAVVFRVSTVLLPCTS